MGNNHPPNIKQTS